MCGMSEVRPVGPWCVMFYDFIIIIIMMMIIIGLVTIKNTLTF